MTDTATTSPVAGRTPGNSTLPGRPARRRPRRPRAYPIFRVVVLTLTVLL